MRKRKEPSRKDSVDLARAQIEAILEEIRVAKQRMMPQWKLLRSFKNLKFADTWEGNQRERDVEKRSKKVREKYEKFLSFEERDLYQKLLKELISDLRDEDDPLNWEPRTKRTLQELNRIKGDMKVAYFDFLESLKDLIVFIKEKQQEDMEELERLENDLEAKESTSSFVQPNTKALKEGIESMNYAKKKDAMIRALYERCQIGEITLAQREAAIERLNQLCESTTTVDENPVDALVEAVNHYIDGTDTAEELDRTLCMVQESHPEVLRAFTGEDIDERYQTVLESVYHAIENDELSRSDAKTWMGILQNGYETEMTHRLLPFFGNDEEQTLLESAMDDGTDPYYNMMDSYNFMVDTIQELVDNGTLTEEAAMEEYQKLAINTYVQMYEHAEDETAVYEYAGYGYADAQVALASSIAVITSAIAIPIGLLGTRKFKANKLIQAYEKLHADTLKVKFSDLECKKMGMEYAVEKYAPELKSIFNRDAAVNGRGYLIQYKGKPFCFLVKYKSAYTSYTSGGGGGGVSFSDSTPRVLYKSIAPEAKKHEDFYRAVMILKYAGMMTPEVKDFLKSELKKAKALKKELKKEEKAAEKKEKAKSKEDALTKEYVEHTTEDALYDKVVSKIRALYENGDICLERREELLMEAKNRFYFS